MPCINVSVLCLDRDSVWQTTLHSILKLVPDVALKEVRPLVFRDKYRILNEMNGALGSSEVVILILDRNGIESAIIGEFSDLWSRTKPAPPFVMVISQKDNPKLPEKLKDCVVWTPLQAFSSLSEVNTDGLKTILYQLIARVGKQLLATAFYPTNAITYATYSLIAIRAITESWEIENVAHTAELAAIPIPSRWNNNVLNYLDKGVLDLAVYNHSESRRYMASHPNHALTVVCGMGASMGGNSFYVLSRDEKIKNLSGQKLLNAISGSKICVPVNADIFESLKIFLGADDEQLYKKNIKIVDIETSITKKELDTLNPSLICAGQNLRFEAKLSQTYKEVFSTKDLEHSRRMKLFERSRNVLVGGRRTVEIFAKTSLVAFGRNLRENFRKAMEDETRLENVIKRVAADLEIQGAHDIVESIIKLSYAFDAQGLP